MPGKLFLVVADTTNLVTDLRVQGLLLEGFVEADRARSNPVPPLSPCRVISPQSFQLKPHSLSTPGRRHKCIPNRGETLRDEVLPNCLRHGMGAVVNTELGFSFFQVTSDGFLAEI